MICKSNRCKSDNFRQSPFIERYGYCPDCKTHNELSDEDLEQMAKEGLLLYRKHERQRLLRQAKEKVRDNKPVAKKAKSRKVKKGRQISAPPPNKKKKQTQSKPPEKSQVACSEHPTYGVVRAPRSDCKTCWSAYAKKHPERMDKYKKS